MNLLLLLKCTLSAVLEGSFDSTVVDLLPFISKLLKTAEPVNMKFDVLIRAANDTILCLV